MTWIVYIVNSVEFGWVQVYRMENWKHLNRNFCISHKSNGFGIIELGGIFFYRFKLLSLIKNNASVSDLNVESFLVLSSIGYAVMIYLLSDCRCSRSRKIVECGVTCTSVTWQHVPRPSGAFGSFFFSPELSKKFDKTAGIVRNIFASFFSFPHYNSHRFSVI